MLEVLATLVLIAVIVLVAADVHYIRNRNWEVRNRIVSEVSAAQRRLPPDRQGLAPLLEKIKP